MKILCLGDIVGPDALAHLSRELWSYRKQKGISLVVANGENADESNGLSPTAADQLLERGVDVITTGNHIWKKNEIKAYLDRSESVIRPLNYPGSCPGKGYTLTDADGYRVLVMNVMGTVFMEPLGCPFDAVDKALSANAGRYDIAILDVHAEATSEKLALAHYFDGRVGIMYGTHTHVQTADEQILPKGSGYMTDLGMCGVQSGILGVENELIVSRLREKMPVRHKLKKGDAYACGAIFEIDPSNSRASSVERVKF